MPKIREHVIAEQAAGAERHRTKRVSLSFQIEVSGRDATGAAFRERAMTSDVSQNGCKFHLLWRLKQHDRVSISVISKDPSHGSAGQPAIFEVVWVEPSDLGWTVGATTIENKNLWHMTFPVKK